MALFQQLLADNQIMLDILNTTFDTATNERQQGIANFMAERIDFHQKYAWQIRSTLKAI
jgi:DNA-binding ferritin-like protein